MSLYKEYLNKIKTIIKRKLMVSDKEVM